MARALLLTIAILLSAPLPSFAAETCECWCGDDKLGAQMIGNTFASSALCSKECTNRGKEYQTCVSKSGGTAPYANLRCWSAEACATASGKFDDKQPAECLNGFHYCLPNDDPVPLAVSLGPITSVRGFGGYIASMYTFLIGAGAVFAILMMIVGGMQYMVKGGAGDVKEAKSRITNALVGFGLLLGSYFLLKTVNPQLVKLQLPELPKVRPVVLPDGSENCEAYYAAGYTILNQGGSAVNKDDPDANKLVNPLQCGNFGTLKKTPQGNQLNTTTKCYYTTQCAKADKETRCQVDTSTEGTSSYEGCKRCDQMVNRDEIAPKPSAGVCAGFNNSYDNTGAAKEYCAYFPVQQSCGLASFDCGSTKTCSDYDRVMIAPFTTSFGGLRLNDSNLPTLKAFCQKDFCGVGPCTYKASGCTK